MKWRSIDTAPEGVPHVRGMWVYSYRENGDRYASYFCANAGYVDDCGAFVSFDGEDDFGWSADDYDYWAPLPIPIPCPKVSRKRTKDKEAAE